MAKKKKKKSKKGSDTKNKSAKVLAKLVAKYAESYTPPPPEAFKRVEDKWVKVHVRLLNWTYLNFEVRCKESTKLYVIMKKIVERHGGSLSQVEMWKEQINPRTKLNDFSLSLKDVFGFDDYVPSRISSNNKNQVHSPASVKSQHEAAPNSDKPADEPRTPSSGKNDKPASQNDSKSAEDNEESDEEEDEEEGDAATAPKVDKPGIEEEQVPDLECVIYYDFKPFETDSPLLLCEPRLASVLADDSAKKAKSGLNKNNRGTPSTPLSSKNSNAN